MKKRVMCILRASNNIEILMGNKTDEVIDRLFNTMLQRFQEVKETSFERGSEFIFETVDSLYHYFQKININRSGSVDQWLSRWIPSPGSRVQNHWVAPRLTQPFILPRLIK